MCKGMAEGKGGDNTGEPYVKDAIIANTADI
jgi:hypothetical protein